jgi:hypothetical protein
MEFIVRFFRLTIVIFLVLSCSELFAVTGTRSAEVTSVQAESANRVGYEDIVYIQQGGSWVGSDCRATHAAFIAKDNPAFTAIVLAARMADKPLKVIVDDSYPLLGGFCQAIHIAL